MRRAAPHPFPASPTRCPACLLLVGPGRACTAAGERRAFLVSEIPPSAGRLRPGPVAGSQSLDAVDAALREAHHTHRPVL
jgi:hypothetical protein